MQARHICGSLGGATAPRFVTLVAGPLAGPDERRNGQQVTARRRCGDAVALEQGIVRVLPRIQVAVGFNVFGFLEYSTTIECLSLTTSVHKIRWAHTQFKVDPRLESPHNHIDGTENKI